MSTRPIVRGTNLLHENGPANTLSSDRYPEPGLGVEMLTASAEEAIQDIDRWGGTLAAAPGEPLCFFWQSIPSVFTGHSRLLEEKWGFGEISMHVFMIKDGQTRRIEQTGHCEIFRHFLPTSPQPCVDCLVHSHTEEHMLCIL